MKRGVLCGAWLLFMAAQVCNAQQAAVLAERPAQFIAPAAAPLVVLNLSHDQQWFHAAYDDVSDLDGDGAPELQFTDRVDYAGYFNRATCYVYKPADQRFVAAGSMEQDARGARCDGASWSGNFLNWASMTRIDLLRQILYGGMRSIDTATLTVLERAHLPGDTHAFVKLYRPVQAADMRRYTPFRVREISLCNVTPPVKPSSAFTRDDPKRYSDSTDAAPLLRVVQGLYPGWTGNARWQCQWNDGGDLPGSPERTQVPDGAPANGDHVVRVQVCDSESAAANPACEAYPSGNFKPVGLLQNLAGASQAEFALVTGSYDRNASGGVLRRGAASFGDEVHASDGRLVSRAHGIVATLDRLRVYGYDDATGTYAGDASDGTAAHIETRGAAGAGAWCRSEADGPSDGRCASWGDPLAERQLDALRYLAGLPAPRSRAAPKDKRVGLQEAAWTDPLSNRDPSLGRADCRPLSVLHFQAGSPTADDDVARFAELQNAARLNRLQLDAAGLTDRIGVREGVDGHRLFAYGQAMNVPRSDPSFGVCLARPLAQLSALRGLCPDVPTGEGTALVAGMAYWAHVHRIRSSPGAATRDDAWRVSTLGVALGGRPASVAIPVRGRAGVQVTLTPVYRLPPATAGARYGAGSLTRWRILEQDIAAGTGRIAVQWDAAEQGGDQGADLWGSIAWCISTPAHACRAGDPLPASGADLYITTSAESGPSARSQGLGYVLSGTTRDGLHIHSGAGGFEYVDPIPPLAVQNLNARGTVVSGAGMLNVSGGCAACRTPAEGAASAAISTRARYALRDDQAAAMLRDPLALAVRYGSFVRGRESDEAWPLDNARGDPDGLIRTSSADALERKLAGLNLQLLQAPQTAVTAAAVVSTTGPTVIASAGFRYDAALQSYSGELVAHSFDFAANAAAPGRPLWNAGRNLDTIDPAARRIVTLNGAGQGIPFEWATLDDDQRAALNRDGRQLAPDAVARGAERLAWLRGDDSTGFKPRASRLGAILNSTPWIAGPPSAGYLDAEAPGYAEFRRTQIARPAMLAVGANDGMLHIFGASDGQPLVSYVPRALIDSLARLTVPGLLQTPGVDGTPFAADVDLAGSDARNDARSDADQHDWRTLLFAPLGRGARAIVALDITQLPQHAQADTRTLSAKLAPWEFDAGVDADLGHIPGEPTLAGRTSQPAQVARMASGQSVVLFGNGYRSGCPAPHGGLQTVPRAALFLINAAGPVNGTWRGATSTCDASRRPRTPAIADYRKLVVDADATHENGLATPVAVPVAPSGTAAQFVYAGDLQGNIWRFDVGSSDPRRWKVAFGGRPLFSARDAHDLPQPVTTAIAVTPHPLGGNMLVFGTGRSLSVGDLPARRSQTLYGIWDRPGTHGPLQADRSHRLLVQQRVPLANPDLIVTTDRAIRDWTRYDGWRLDLTLPSEVLVYNPAIRDGAVASFQTVFSNRERSALQTADAAQACGPGFGRVLYQLSPFDGARLPATFDINGDGRIDVRDLVPVDSSGVTVAVSGRVDPAGGPMSGIRITGVRIASGQLLPQPDGTVVKLPEKTTVQHGRLNWREVSGSR